MTLPAPQVIEREKYFSNRSALMLLARCSHRAGMRTPRDASGCAATFGPSERRE